jgi:predicted RNA-binding Zn-ribbon protein involved in translation (DUF1610 family)
VTTRTLVRLEPPYTRSLGSCEDTTPLTRGPRLIRTAGMGRWHRPRSGVHLNRHGQTVFHVWCGQGVRFGDAITAAALPADQFLCGTCEGRAIGAGHLPTGTPLNEALLFQPQSSAPPPARCPSHRLSVSNRFPHGVFACPVCGEATRLRAAGGPYNSRLIIEGHAPGPGLIAPCPFHRWDWPALREGLARCGCGAPIRPPAVAS